MPLSWVLTVLAFSEVDAALLKQLAEHDDRMEKFLDAHEVTQDAVVKELDGDGKLLHTTVSKLKQKRVNGKLKTTVVSSTRDGADAREAEQKRAADQDEKNDRTESPFAPRNQPSYRFALVGPAKQGSPELLIGFEPKAGPSKELLKGLATVDPTTGEVVKLVMEPSKLPSFVDAMHLELEYENRTAAGRAISKFVMSGAGGFLFIKRQGDLTVKFTFE